MPVKLSTHALDLTLGQPAIGLALKLYALPADAPPQLLVKKFTNPDGRTDEPLLMGDELPLGRYELIFSVGDYFRQRDCASVFLDEVPIRFLLHDPKSSYHIPLLFTPWAFSTYRGS